MKYDELLRLLQSYTKIFILEPSGTTKFSLGFMEQGYFPIGEPYNYNMEEREDYPYPLTNLDEPENVLCKSLDIKSKRKT